MMLHNGVDPTQPEGMCNMTPLAAFRTELETSPYGRGDPESTAEFTQNAESICELLQNAEKAMQLKATGDTAFGEKNYAKALENYAAARTAWNEKRIRGHHVAVLWYNSAKCHLKTKDWDRCRSACAEGLKHFCTAPIREKLEVTPLIAAAAQLIPAASRRLVVDFLV